MCLWQPHKCEPPDGQRNPLIWHSDPHSGGSKILPPLLLNLPPPFTAPHLAPPPPQLSFFPLCHSLLTTTEAFVCGVALLLSVTLADNHCLVVIAPPHQAH